jgi:hypothetical protein
MSVLRAAGVLTMVRRTMGDDIAGACGQLVREQERFYAAKRPSAPAAETGVADIEELGPRPPTRSRVRVVRPGLASSASAPTVSLRSSSAADECSIQSDTYAPRIVLVAMVAAAAATAGLVLALVVWRWSWTQHRSLRSGQRDVGGTMGSTATLLWAQHIFSHLS